MNTKADPSYFDGMERAEPDEPVFPLRAKDDLAAPLVRDWVDRRRKQILSADLPDDKRRLELMQCTDADLIAAAMDDWRAGRKDQDAEIPQAAKTPRYSGNETDPDELAAKLHFDAQKEAARRLDNIVAELVDVAKLLHDLDITHSAGVEATAVLMKGVAEDIRPKRASYAHRA